MSRSPRRTRLISLALAASVTLSSLAPAVQAAEVGGPLIGTEQALAAATTPDAAPRARLLSALERADVAAALSQRGVSVDQARERVAALSDAEAALVAERIDSAPAGADGVLGTLVFIFVLLLVTDILGLTKVFPFTRSVR